MAKSNTMCHGVLVCVMVLVMSAVVEARPRQLLGATWVPLSAKILNVQTKGVGCLPPAVSISPDGQAVSILFDNYKVAVPEGPKYMACNFLISLKYPVGWVYSASAWTYRGSVMLDRCIMACQQSEYIYQGSSGSLKLKSCFDGGEDGLPLQDVEFTDVATNSLLSTPCMSIRGLTVLTKLWIDDTRNKGGEGFITTENIEGQMWGWVLKLKWSWCGA